MKRKIAGIIIIICIIAAVLLIVRGLRPAADKAGGSAAASEAEKTETVAYVYVESAGTYLSLDADGMVCMNSSSRPGSIPMITGIEFTSIVYGSKAETEETAGLEYVLRVAEDLYKKKIFADKIEFSGGTASICISDLTIKLGRNDKTDEKINDLADFYDKVIGRSGVLNMQNADAGNYGYTFREN